jgi:hypothetical protein
VAGGAKHGVDRLAVEPSGCNLVAQQPGGFLSADRAESGPKATSALEPVAQAKWTARRWRS